MTAARVVLLVALAASPLSAAKLANQGGRSVDSVIQKVVEMLEANKAKVAKDLASEEKEMASYTEYCDDEITTREYDIKDGVRKIGDLTAVIEDTEAQSKEAEDSIVALGSEMADKEKDLVANGEARKTEQADFKETEKTLIASIDQLDKAIMMIKKDEAAFLQKKGKPTNRKAFAKALETMMGTVIDAAWVGADNTKALKGFIQQEQTAGAGAGDAEEFSLKRTAQRHKQKEEPEKSGGVAQTLADMKTKAEETLSNTRLEEMKAEHNYQMMTQTITDAISNLKSKIDEAKDLKATLGEAAGTAQGQLSEAKKTKIADSQYLKTLKMECESAASAWAERQVEAKAEMAAIEKAKEILSSKVKVLVQRTGDYYDTDGSSDSADQSPVRTKLVQHLKELSHRFTSYALAEMASAAAQDPFEKVKGIIEDMIAKLVAEASEEATQKSFCDEEKTKSVKERDAKTTVVDELSNRMSAASARKATLLENIKALQTELSEMEKAAAEATKLRGEERATYLQASKDYKDAAEAVTDAIKVLKEYYASTSLVQAGSGAKRGQRAPSAAASSIISILENSGEEFTKMLMETEADEKEAVDAYNTATQENAISKAAKEAEVKGSESEVKSLEVTIASSSGDHKMAVKELDAILEYLDKLKPQCEAKVITYEEKKAKREQEIEGLKEALSILDAPALVQTHKH